MCFGSQHAAPAHKTRNGQLGDAIVALSPTGKAVSAIGFCIGVTVAIGNLVGDIVAEKIGRLDELF